MPRQQLVDPERQGFFAGMGRGGDPDLAGTDLGGEGLQPGWIARRRVHVIFEVADRLDARRAQLQQARRIVLALRQAEVDAAEKRGNEAGNTPPPGEGARRQAGVDEGDGNAPRVDGANGVGPDFRFRQQEQVRPPMVEKSFDEARGVQRHILMAGAGRQSLRENARRGHGAAGDKDMKPFGDQPFHQGQQGQAFADARAVQPGQPAVRAGQAGDPAPLAEPGGLFLAPAGASP